MAVIDVHILAQAVLYMSVLCAGFCIAIPIGVNRVSDMHDPYVNVKFTVFG